MSELEGLHAITAPEEELSFWDKHRLSLLLIIAVIVAITLTTVSVIIYSVSGAAQLDLSRPGYKSVSSQVEKDSGVSDYSSTGKLDEKTIKEFVELYDEQSERVKAVDAFNGDPLNPEILQLAEVSQD